MDKLDIIIDIQKRYKNSCLNKTITNFKKECLKIAQEYCLSDDEFFKIARDQISLEEMRDILNNVKTLHEGDIL